MKAPTATWLAASTPLAAILLGSVVACADMSLDAGSGGDGATGDDGQTSATGGDGTPLSGETAAVGSGQGGGFSAGAYLYDPESTGPGDGTGGRGGSGGGNGGGNEGGSGPIDCADAPAEDRLTALLTIDDSNSYASPMLVRELTKDEAWTVGDPLPVRAHEFLNAYGQKIHSELLDEDIDDALHVGADASVDEYVDGQGRRLVRLAVSFTSVNAAEVAVPDVTFVMDTSASMDGEAVERLQGVVRGAGRLIPTSRSVAAYTTNAGGTLVRAMGLWNGDVEPMELAATELDPQADFEATLGKALDTAREQALFADNPGVVLVVTDGANPLSSDGLARITQERNTWPPVRVVGVGVGPARTYVDDLLERVTDDSGGAYLYAPSREEAEAELAARYTALTQIAARNVELAMQVPESMEVVGVVGSEPPPPDAAGPDGQNLGADSTMTFQVYLLAPADGACQSLGVSVKWLDPADDDPSTAQRSFPRDGSFHPLPIWHRFDPAHQLPPTPTYLRVETILAVADALRGPTSARIRFAAEKMDAFLTEFGADDPGSSLCEPLARFCAADGTVDCLACAPP